MMRIVSYVCVLLVCAWFQLDYVHAQEPREVRPIEPRPNLRREALTNSIPQFPTNRRVIPESFFRNEQFLGDRVPKPNDVRDGTVRSFPEIRNVVRNRYPGKIVDVRMLIPKREGISVLYDFRVLTDGGKVLSIKVDAKSAQIVDVKG